MYLTKLYHYNKLLFAAIVFFAVMQLLVTYKRGMVISPWYNYGMYSEKIYPKKVYEVNNLLLSSAGWYLISPQYDDKINLTLDNYRRINQNDSLYQIEIVRLFKKFYLPEPQKKYFQSPFGIEVFKLWFEKNVSNTRDLFMNSAARPISTTKVVWNGSELKMP